MCSARLIDWYDTNVPLDVIERLFGASWIRWFLEGLTQEEALIRISCRSQGAWYANQREAHACWISLARAIREGRYTIEP